MLKIPKLSLSQSKRKIKSIAVLTSGGDAPGMNAAIRSVVRFSIVQGCKTWGIQRGYSGLLEGQIYPMELSSVANIIQRGGTILKTDRCESFLKRSVRKEAAHLLRRKEIDALVVIGGDGSFAGAYHLEKDTEFPVIGIPATIDNDIYGTDATIGFDTAVNTGIDSIDKIRDTASSHDRLFIVEVMGRNSGFIALSVGIGGGAETVLIPEFHQTNAAITKSIDRGIKRGKTSSIIVVAEGSRPGQTARLAESLRKKGHDPKVCILGHIQRGGRPSGRDRMLASTFGGAAVNYLLSGKSCAMVGVQHDEVALIPLRESIGKRKKPSKDLLKMAQVLAT